MAGLKDIVVDAQRPSHLARFWAETLDGYSIRAYDQAEIDRLAGRGLTPNTDPAVALDGPGPSIFFQITDQQKTSRNRLHLDLSCASRVAEVERLIDLGATLRDVRDTYSVMQDPEGNEFCIQDP